MFKHSRVLWCSEKCCNEDEEGLRLDGGAVVGVEQIEEEVHVDFATEDDARWGVQQEQTLYVRQRGENEDVVLAI